MNKIYNIVVDAYFDENLKTFSTNLSEGERIVSTCLVTGGIGSDNRFVICTELAPVKGRNLLKEELVR